MIPRSRESIKDMAIAGAFIAISLFVPGQSIIAGFSANISGIALGIGLGWLIKSIIDHLQGVKREA
ncbi:MAG: hypothetical protein ACYCSS_09890 [Sulfuriferula sp.]